MLVREQFVATNVTPGELADGLREGSPRHVARFGDGEILCCVDPRRGGNCDGHLYSESLADALVASLEFFVQQENLILGNWFYWPLGLWLHALAKKFGGQDDWILHEVFMHHKWRNQDELRDLYGAIQETGRRKVIVGPLPLSALDGFLGFDKMIVTPEQNGWDVYYEIEDQTAAIIQPGDLVLLAFGMPAKPLMAAMMKEHPQAVFWDIGSGVDPLVPGRKTRANQMDPETLEGIYGDGLHG